MWTGWPPRTWAGSPMGPGRTGADPATAAGPPGRPPAPGTRRPGRPGSRRAGGGHPGPGHRQPAPGPAPPGPGRGQPLGADRPGAVPRPLPAMAEALTDGPISPAHAVVVAAGTHDLPAPVAADGLLEPEAGQTLLAALDPLARPQRADDARSGGQRSADALIE